jgi:hypothetical protein
MRIALSKQHGADGCDLWLVVYAIVALSAATDVYGFQRFATTLGLPAWAGALGVMPIKFVEWKFLTFAVRLFRSGTVGKLVSFAPVMAWCIAVSLSMLAAHSSIRDTLASVGRAQAKKTETRAHLAAELSAVDAQITSLSEPRAPRPVKVVEEALEWIALPDDVRRLTHNCTRFSKEGQREACKESIALRKELAAAREYQRLMDSSSMLHARLDSLDIEAAEVPLSHSFKLFFGRFVEADGKDGIAFMGMALLTLVSSLGPFGLYLVGRADGPAPTKPAPASLDGEAVQAGEQRGAQGAQADRVQPNSAAGSAHDQYAQGTYGKPAQGEIAHAQPALGPAHIRSDQEPAQPALEPAHPSLGVIAKPAQLRPAHLPAQPAQESAQSIDAPAATSPELSPGEPAHGFAHAGRVINAEPAQVMPAHDRPDVRPPVHKPARPSSRRGGQTNGPARPRADRVAPRSPGGKVVHLRALQVDRYAKELAAIRSFVAMLDRAPNARATGSALADAYKHLRPVHGWAKLAPNVFGSLLKAAVQEIGGRKLKSGSQVYVGVSLPAEWLRAAA